MCSTTRPDESFYYTRTASKVVKYTLFLTEQQGEKKD